MRESVVTGLAEDAKFAKAYRENVGHGMGEPGDELKVIQEMKSCYSSDNEANKDGKEFCEDGVASRLGRKKRMLNGKEKIAGGKVEFVGRVLRSRSAITLESQTIGCELDMVVGEHSSSMVGPCANGETHSLHESPQVIKTDSDDLGVELETTMKRKRGRPPKVNVGSETNEPNVAVLTKALDESLNVVKASSDDSDVVQVTTMKRKRGRPSKLKAPSLTSESDVAVVAKVKGRRGRPSKKLETALETNHAVMTNLKRDRGRPTMFQVRTEAESDTMVIPTIKDKQSRLPRLSMTTETLISEGLQDQEADGVSKTIVEKKKKRQGRWPKSEVGLRGMLKQPKTHCQSRFLKIHKNSRGRKVVNDTQEKSSAPHANKYDSEPDHGVDSQVIDAVAENMMKGRALRSKRLPSSVEYRISDFGTGNNETSSRTNLVELRVKRDEKIDGCGRSVEKHLVREQIKDMLLKAGWTIEYRPRMSREYTDAVYVSPQGRAYWSATLAYKVLKSHCENTDAASQKVKSGFTFKLIPEDVMNLLTRTTKKKKESLATRGLHASEMDLKLNQKLKKKERLQKLTLHASDTGKKINKKSRATKHSTRIAGSCHEAQSQKFIVESNGKLSRGKSKNAETKRRHALLVRDSEKGVRSSTFNLYPGKRMVLNWMLDLGTVPLDVNVHYRGQQQRTRRTHGGRIARDGICCGCCNEVVTLSEFQVHAKGKSDYPSQYIYLQDGTSLLQRQLHTWNKQDSFQRKGFHSLNVTCDDPNDDSCGICANGGELICCDGCTSTFHLGCLNLPKFPFGEWHCVYCSCKFCGQVGGGSCRCNMDGFETFMLSTCHLCEAKYHKFCIQTDHATNDTFDFSSFCGTECQEVLKKLTSLVGVKNDLEDGYSWTLLHRFDVGSDSNLSEMPLKIECNSKLAVAVSIMDECFLPIIDHRTGINLIHNVVYNCGSNFTRLNYSGFYTVILEKCDELISAASIRVHGDGLAEMPFIGTRHNYRRQGMCGRLLGAIEDALRSLGVKKVIIPAISELLQTWTSVFGFEPLGADERQKLKNVNLLVFPCTDLLQKTILETTQRETLLPTDVGFLEDAVGEHSNLDPKSRDETSSCNVGVSHLMTNMENQDLDTQLNGFLDQDDHLLDEGTVQIAQKFHEVPCINAVSETAQATLGVSNPSK